MTSRMLVDVFWQKTLDIRLLKMLGRFMKAPTITSYL